MTSAGAALLFVGFFSAIGLYNALVYCTTRDRPFLWYFGIMASMAAIEVLFEPSLLGISVARNSFGLNVLRPAILIAFFASEAGFAISFLRLPEHLPRYVRAIVVLLSVNIAGIILENALPATALHRVLDDLALFAFLGTCAAAGARSRRLGHYNARYYLLAFAGACAGVVINDVAQDLAWHNAIAAYSFQTGMAWEGLFLALALAGRARFATIDQLTGVGNRRAFDEALPTLWMAAMRGKTALALLFIDVDDFKGYNDTYGHPAGDDLLRRIAHLCASCCERSDIFTRYGGDEFAAILPHVSASHANGVARRMREIVEQSCPVTISVGVAVLDETTTSAHQLVAHSDAALYDAKALLKSRLRQYAGGE